MNMSIGDGANIVIGGQGSYIGTNVCQYLNAKEKYTVIELNLRDSNWRMFDFSQIDVVFQVAGVAHQKETGENAHLYYQVNCDLAVEMARIAKAAGVKQYIYMSSMAVYGCNESKEDINLSTPANPQTHYGKSKYQAEQSLMQLADDGFKVALLRPPMVYGNGAPGNLERLFQAVRCIHVFPDFKNERSSISIHNLCAAVKKIIDNKSSGIFLPQDSHYHCTTDIVKKQMQKEQAKVWYTSLFNPLLELSIGRIDVITKAFGNLRYSR